MRHRVQKGFSFVKEIEIERKTERGIQRRSKRVVWRREETRKLNNMMRRLREIRG